MTDPHLRTLLEEASADVPAPDLAPLVLRGAHRRGRQRWAWVAAATVTAAAVGVVATVPAGPRAVDPPPLDQNATTPPSPPEDEESRYADMLTDDMVQELWTPGRLATLDWLDSSFPRVLPTSSAGLPELSEAPLDSAIAVIESVDSPTEVIVVGAGGEQRVVRIENVVALTTEYADEPVTLARGASVSPDGNRLALLQPGHIVVVDVADGTQTRYEVPQLTGLGTWARSVTEWSPDGSHILFSTVKADSERQATLDLGDGSIRPAPSDGYFETTTYGPDGSIFQYVGNSPAVRNLLRYEGSRLVERHTAMAYVGVLHSMRAGGQAIAAVREAISGLSIPRAPYMMDGIVVLNHQGDGLALLPLKGDSGTRGDYGYLVFSEVLGWVDAETVLISFGEPGRERALVSWNYVTEELLRVADLPDDVEIDVAAGLLD